MQDVGDIAENEWRLGVLHDADPRRRHKCASKMMQAMIASLPHRLIRSGLLDQDSDILYSRVREAEANDKTRSLEVNGRRRINAKFRDIGRLINERIPMPQLILTDGTVIETEVSLLISIMRSQDADECNAYRLTRTCQMAFGWSALGFYCPTARTCRKP